MFRAPLKLRITFSQLQYFTTVQQPERFLLRSELLTVMYRRIAELATLHQRVPLVRVDVLLEAVVISVVLLGSAGVSPALSIHRAFCLSVRLRAIRRLRVPAVAVAVAVAAAVAVASSRLRSRSSQLTIRGC